ncbi:hypothetical protein FDF08_01725 [Micrococcus luteus]|nr:hypothetical protein FDF08_01725 [Micrococcus luteus]
MGPTMDARTAPQDPAGSPPASAAPALLLLAPLAGDVLSTGPLATSLSSEATIAGRALTTVLALVGAVLLLRGGRDASRSLRAIGGLAVAAALARGAGVVIGAIDRSDSSLSWFATIWLFLFGGAVLAGLGVAALLRRGR